MRVAVTGSTGFVGCHTVAALVKAGHSVRLLVRSKDRIAPALRPLGVDPAHYADYVEGDVTDPDSVRRLLEGTDAVIHGASVYSLDPRRDRVINTVNVRGTDLVLGTATEMGLGRIIHVSSIVALVGERGAVLTPDTVPGRPMGTYMRSKADSERVARRYQEQGSPVVISYPCTVWGPHDPYVGETCHTIRQTLGSSGVIYVRGTWPASDVRDLAALHVSLLSPDLKRSRYFAPSHAATVAEMFSIFREATGRKLPTVMFPERLVRPGLLLSEALSRRTRIPPFATASGAWYLGLHHTVDDSATRTELGLTPRPLKESVVDTVRWMVREGHLSPKQAGKLAEEAEPTTQPV